MSNQPERNFHFAVLQSIAIFFVVVGHLDDILYQWFPIYSFHMPLFIFISGYFFKEEWQNTIFKSIYSKFKKFVIPAYIFNFIYGLIFILIKKYQIIDYGGTFNLFNLFISPLQEGSQFAINGAIWFPFAIFFIQVAYLLVRKIALFFKPSAEGIEYLLMSFLLLCGVYYVLLLCEASLMGGTHFVNRGWGVTISHICFGLPFYQLGRLYRVKLERVIDRCPNVYFFTGIFIFQLILLIVTDHNIYVGMLDADYNDFTSFPVLAFFAPLFAILFWVRFAKILSRGLCKSNLIDFISRNTWTIMLHHYIVLFAINLFFLFSATRLGFFTDFDINRFRTVWWYSYNAFGSYNFILVYVLLGISLPLIVKYFLLRNRSDNKIFRYFANIF